jgi:hypothetical protein
VGLGGFSAPRVLNVRISRTSKEAKDELVGSAIEQNFFSSQSHYREEYSDTGWCEKLSSRCL